MEFLRGRNETDDQIREFIYEIVEILKRSVNMKYYSKTWTLSSFDGLYFEESSLTSGPDIVVR